MNTYYGHQRLDHEDNNPHYGTKPLPADLKELTTQHRVGYDYYDATKRVRKVLGVGTKIPADMEGEFNVDGHTVVVVKSKPGVERPYNRNRSSKSSKHRIYFKVGERLIPVGRIAQVKL